MFFYTIQDVNSLVAWLRNVGPDRYHLLNFLTAVYGNKPSPSLICDVVPAGTAPYNLMDQEHPDMLEFRKTESNPKEGGYIEQFW